MSLKVHVFGQGRIVAGSASCETSCELQVGRSTSVVAVPSAGWRFDGWTGLCEGTGRRLVVTTEGNGGGSIAVDGLACASPCELVVPVDRPVEVTAIADDTSRLLGFSGDCVGNACTLGIGSTELAVTVTFASVLQWARSFPIPSAEGDNVALYADDGGIYVAVSVRRSMEIDGVLYTEPYVFRNGSPYFIELAWDAGVQSVLPFYDYVDAGYTRTDVASLTKGPDGTLFAFGGCFQGHFLGQPCGAVSSSDGVPFVLEVQDGGVRTGELRVDLQDNDPVGFLDSHLVGDSLVARVFRHDQYPNGQSGFYVRGRGADAGVITLAPDMVSGGATFANNLRECIAEGESLVCVSPVSGVFTGLGCPSSGPAGNLAAYRYTPSNGACEVTWRMPAGSFAYALGLARAVSGTLQFIGGGANAPYDFGSGFTLNGAAWWLGALDGAAMVALTPSPMPPSQLARPVAIVAASAGGSLVLAKTGPTQPGPSGPLFGIPLTANDSAHVLTFTETGQLIRTWPLLGGAANAEEIRNGTMTRVGDDIVVALMGSGYTFRGQPLAPDLQLRLFVMVFRE